MDVLIAFLAICLVVLVWFLVSERVEDVKRQVTEDAIRAATLERNVVSLTRDLGGARDRIAALEARIGASAALSAAPPVAPPAAPSAAPPAAPVRAAGKVGAEVSAEPVQALPPLPVEPAAVQAPAPQPPRAWVGAAAPTPTRWRGPQVQGSGRAPLARAPAPVPSGPGHVARLARQLGLEEPAAGGGWSRASLDAWLEGRMLAVVGGVALLLAAIFFLGVAISRGWIGPEVRVAIGLAAGAALVTAAELLFRRGRSVVGHVLIAVGIATVSLALFAATRLYGLVPAEVGLLGALIVSMAAAGVAVRHDSQLVAAFGLIAVLAAPPLLGASATFVTLLFVGVTLLGTTAIALFRTWVWLPPLAFVLSAPQLAAYIAGGAPAAEALAALAGYWLIMTIAAGGEEFRHPTDVLRPSTATLLLANAALVVAEGFIVLSGSLEGWRGLFLVIVAISHLAVGLWFLARNSDRHPFGLLVSGTGIAALSMAIPIQLNGPPVPIGWAAEAAALAWVAALRRHGFSAGAALLLGALAIGHLCTIEYPPRLAIDGLGTRVPFVGGEGLTFAFLVGSLAVAGVLSRIAWARVWLAAVAAALAVYVGPFELSGPALVAGWMAVGAVAVLVDRLVAAPRLAGAPPATDASGLGLPAPLSGVASTGAAALRGTADTALVVAGLAGGLLALAHLVTLDYPFGHLVELEFPAGWSSNLLSTPPFLGPEGLSLAGVLLGFGVVGVLLDARWIRLGLAGLGLILVTYGLPFEVPMPALLVGWAVLAVASLGVGRRLGGVVGVPSSRAVAAGGAGQRRPSLAVGVAERMPYVAAGTALIGAAAIGLHVLPVSGFLGGALGLDAVPATPFRDEGTLCAAVLAAMAVASGLTWGGRAALHLGVGAAGLLVAYLLPFELRPAMAVVGWSVIVVGAVAVVRVDPGARGILGPVAAGLLAFAALVALGVVAPPTRLVVSPLRTIDHPLLLGDATAALGAIALALATGWALLRADRLGMAALALAGVTFVYLLSIGLVDEFQRQLVGVAAADLPARAEDLGKQAQTGLSVLWSVLGGFAFGSGLVLRRAPVRLAGLAVLGLATAKVFLVDLAYLDLLYRVLVLVALGVLLLLSAYLYEHLQRPHAPHAV